MRPLVFGIDISDRSVEIVSLGSHKGVVSLSHLGRRDVPVGVISRGIIHDRDALTKILVDFFDETFGKRHGPLRAAVALPATAVYSRTSIFPAESGGETVRQAVAAESAEVFPIAVSEAVDDIVIGTVRNGRRIAYHAAVHGSVARDYRDVLVDAGCEPIFLDGEDLALVRGVDATEADVPLMTIDIGGRSTLLVVVDGENVMMSASLPFGGDKLLDAISDTLQVDRAEAERLLKVQGLDAGHTDAKLFLTVQRALEPLMAEIRKTMTYAERRLGIRIRGIIAVGSTSIVPGFVDYVASHFQELAVALGNPFRGVVAEEGAPLPSRRESVRYAVAIGLATRAIGVRGSPGINLMPMARQDTTVAPRITRHLFQALTAVIPMVTHAKKAHPRKEDESDAQANGAMPSSEAMSVGAGASAVGAAGDVSKPAPRPRRAKKAAAPPEEAPVARPSQPAIDTYALPVPGEQETSVRAAASEEPDFGLGIGDILHPDEGVKPRKVAMSAMADADGSGKLSIESILNRGVEPEKPVDNRMEEEDEPVMRTRYSDGPRERHSGAKTAALVVLVLLFFAMAAAGVYMFVMKNGVSSLLALGGMKKASPVASVSGPQVPSSVNTVVMISTKAPDGGTGTKTFLLSRAIETDVTATDTFASTGTGTAQTGGKSTGTATIINTTTKAYTFVATTRLLSKDGVLFRMKKTTPIPANASVDVAVAADQPGSDGDIGPTTFTIPGLSPDLQKVITAKSDAAMSGGGGKGKAVAASDLDGAKAALTEKLSKEAGDNFAAMLSSGETVNSELVTSKEMSVKAPKEGTNGATFSMTLTLRFHALLVPEKAILPLLNTSLSDALPNGMSVADYTLGSPIYTVQAYDTAADTAEVRVEAPVVGR